MNKGIVVFAVCLLFAAVAANADVFWVSLGADNDSNEPIFLMKIDENGNILIPATVVVPRSNVADPADGELPTALAHGPGNRLMLWIGNDTRTVVYRALIDKDTLNLLSVRKVLSGNDFDFLPASQESRLFLVFEKKSARAFGQFMDDKGLPVARGSFRPTLVRPVDKAAVSADGTMSVADDDDNDKLYANPINPFTGKITGPYLVADNVDVCDVDVTNILPNGRRFAVFAECSSDRYYLVTLDGVTGRHIGPPVQLLNLEIGEVDQEIALDPAGRFVIFSIDDADIGCSSTGIDIPVFLKLNQNSGEPIGSPKPLVPCDLTEPFGSGDIFGIDILREH